MLHPQSSSSTVSNTLLSACVSSLASVSRVIITHRLSTLDLADRILVPDKGCVADIGTHKELIGRCELYQRLHDIQLRQTA